MTFGQDLESVLLTSHKVLTIYFDKHRNLNQHKVHNCQSGELLRVKRNQKANESNQQQAWNY